MMDKLQKFCVISLTQGGRHADNTVDLQEFMIMPTGAENMEQAIRMCAEVYQFLRIILKQKGLSTAVGDEGGFAPDLSDSESVLEVILEAVTIMEETTAAEIIVETAPAMEASKMEADIDQ